MKTIPTLLLAFLVFSLSQSSFAQGFGVRAGANFSSASDGNFGKIKSNNGYYLGVYKEMSIVPKLLYIQPEVQFSKQGFTTSTSDFDLNYVQVPILAKLYALKIVSFETGPQFGFKVSDKIDGPQNPDFKTFDSAWAFGMSLNLPFGLAINGRYIGSFKEVIKDSDSKNQVIQLGASFTF
ncbi:outer membrane beta-barrel protein [Flavobacterium sp.]|uniref:outer membrane beta-barrel protein n=1 Tax=Flavobacterium sp. TaxID=239 RepID=UPI0022C8594A|nr:outer membrane beta-barrel protein [Flavobacterium sp.]MCZ8230195.1 outer membrane beta-barrel protein [Flavobacterium sp.]